MKIYLALINTGWINSELAIRLIRWIHESKYDVYYESSNLRPLENNRNTVVQRFLKSDSDYLLMLDDDNVPTKNPLMLADFRKDIVTQPVPIYQDIVYLNAFLKKEDYLEPISLDDPKGLIEIDSTGTGIIMCSRKVLETIKKPFERIFDEDGIAILGSDLAFSEKAKEAGFRIYTDTSSIAKHYKSVNLCDFV
jgi:hypothetical protein